MSYVDGFVIPIPTRNVKAYRRMAAAVGRLFRSHGALEVHECVADDSNPRMGMPFAKLAKAKRGETVVFAWVVYRSRAHRDAVNARMEKDPNLLALASNPANDLFDMKRVAYGGFASIVDQ